MMTKKDFISLADALRENSDDFGHDQMEVLANWCAFQNPRFKRELWLDYIAGLCGPNGGKLRTPESPKGEACEAASSP